MPWLPRASCQTLALACGSNNKGQEESDILLCAPGQVLPAETSLTGVKAHLADLVGQWEGAAPL